MKEIIKELWKYFDERKFDKAKELLHKEFKGYWKTTLEIFETRDNFIEVNKMYPGNWRTQLQKVEMTENGAVSVTYVYSKESENKFYATTFYKFKDNLIYRIEEYWATCEKSSSWRNKYIKLSKN